MRPIHAVVPAIAVSVLFGGCASLATQREPPARPWTVSAYVRAAARGRPGVASALDRYLGWLNEQVIGAEEDTLAELLTRLRELNAALGLELPRERVYAWCDAMYRRALAGTRYAFIIELGELLLDGDPPDQQRARWLYRVGWAPGAGPRDDVDAQPGVRPDPQRARLLPRVAR